MNEGLDSDFFTKQYRRLQPMTNEEYRNAPKRTTSPHDDVEDWRALKAMSPAERRLYSGEREDHRFDGLDPDGGDAL